MDMRMTEKKSTAHRDLEWQNRVLCSDEGCIGVIGPDRRCKECGRLYEGTLPSTFDDLLSGTDPASPADQAAAADDMEADATTTGMDASGDPEASPDDWDQRVLCSDESCIGVIGPDGRCKECGKPYKG
jgi:hypothetical protein